MTIAVDPYKIKKVRATQKKFKYAKQRCQKRTGMKFKQFVQNNLGTDERHKFVFLNWPIFLGQVVVGIPNKC